jgi:hypothetical protein
MLPTRYTNYVHLKNVEQVEYRTNVLCMKADTNQHNPLLLYTKIAGMYLNE